ncbi:hypothetical protein E6Q11_00380 [Candidatus Dojkabacteria bacterium]|uniref:Uncharacterized protein n=1 Tax=Candidatus Dojkabacteria bacterium TaxID=2099670 RepID=A0A5C7JB14_9BACT|nr:MAG: hypothetical protein E6Q11_00380 [Candidatus Dojkabacteria bacterium]
MKRVRIKALPKAQAGMNFTMPVGAHPAYKGSVLAPGVYAPSGFGSVPETKVNGTLQPTDWEHANLEAEKGETVVTHLNKGGIPEFYNIGGKRHYDGGTPLNLPPDSFVFSRDKKMKIKDSEILDHFGKTNDKSYTPAELSRKYDLNKYHKILADPNSSKLDIKTAEMMIENYNNKLGQLALVQESMKGFPDGIPGIAMPYLATAGINPADFAKMPGQENPNDQPQARYGGAPNATAIKAIEPKSSAVYSNMTPRMQDGGSVRRKVRVHLGYMQDGGGTPAPSTSGTPTTSQNVPKDAVKWDMTKEGYDESQVQPGDYVRKADGKWYKVKGYTQKNYGYSDARLGDLQPAYGHMQNTIMSNPDLQEAIYTNYQKHIKNGELSEAEKKRLLDIPPEQVINNFLQGQKQVYAINASGVLYEKDKAGNIIYENGKPKMKSEKELKVWETRESEEYKKRMKELGFNEDEIFTGLNTAMFQAAYKGLQDASGDEKFKGTLENFNLTPVGLKDSHGKHTYQDKPISPVDKFFGNTTAGQAVLPKELDKELTMEEYTPEEPKPEDPEKPLKHLGEPAKSPYAPWWLQDIINTAGAAGDYFRAKKYGPWQATPGVDLMSPTFQDPTRQLAANAELANIATQGAGMFSGPQAYNARSSQIQGQAATNVANTLASVHGMNVQIANQFEMANAQLMNQASDRKAQLATNLYDKNTIANQQFDFEKGALLHNLRNNYVNAITNRAQTQTMNSLYPQFAVDPTSGGFMHFTQGRDIKPKQSNKASVMDRAAEYKRMNPGWDDAAYVQMAKADAGIPDTTPGAGFGVNPAEFAYPGGMPSGYMGG